MTTRTILRWLERALLAFGAAIGVWSAAIMLDARFVANMPPPAPPAPSTSGIPTGIVIPARGTWIAKLDAPTVSLSATILEGSDDETLARGAGHIEYTPFPGQPGNGNVGIAGHRDTTFRAVRHLKTGDPLELTTATSVHRYLITRTFIVDPEDVYVLDPGDEPMLTLVTCYPFEFIGHAPKRYIVQAALIDTTPRTEPKLVVSR
jgi:LPXTG-site transpeptidase (sortase) family protein